jgi:hypothetical protein
MTSERSHTSHRLFSLLLASMLVAGCAPKKATTGAFAEIGGLESKLQRKVSTKRDVQRVLGPPDGFGSAYLPVGPKLSFDPKPREVWYYSDIELTGMKGEGGGVILVDVRQQVLLVLFDEGVFDGFMWFSNAGVAEVE